MVNLRPIEEEDLIQLRDWRNSDCVRRFCNEYKYLNLEDQKVWFHQLTKNHRLQMWVIEENGKPLGVCGLVKIYWQFNKGEISLYVGDEVNRQKGIGTKALKIMEKIAFDEFNLHSLTLVAFGNNPAAIKLALKNNYKESGRMREAIFKDGKFWDAIIFDKLEYEYRMENVKPI